MKTPLLLWPLLTLGATSVDAFCPISSHSTLRQNIKSTVPTAPVAATCLSQPSTGNHRRTKTSLDASMASIMIRGGAAASSSLPGVPLLILASLLPTCLGYWRQGYTVSYGYGGAVASIATLMLLSVVSSATTTTLATVHASALLFYGVRLCGFLLTRELTTPVEVHQMKRRDESLSKRLQKTPLILACSIFYFLLAAAPLRITAASSSTFSATSVALLVSTFLGFGVAAVGDWYKSAAKARQKDPQSFLVTTGPFRFLRHPNYTGEMLGWTSSFALAVTEANIRSATTTTPWVWLALATVGWLGILGVLAGEATGGLERKQEEKYGGTPEYEAWVRKSWSGPML